MNFRKAAEGFLSLLVRPCEDAALASVTFGRNARTLLTTSSAQGFSWSRRSCLGLIMLDSLDGLVGSPPGAFSVGEGLLGKAC